MAEMNWMRVGEYVARRRGELGIGTQEDAAAAAHVGVQLWREIERGLGGRIRLPNKAAVARTLGWSPDALDVIAKGGEPPPDLAVADLTRRVEALESLIDRIELIVLELRTALGRAGEPPQPRP